MAGLIDKLRGDQNGGRTAVEEAPAPDATVVEGAPAPDAAVVDGAAVNGAAPPLEAAPPDVAVPDDASRLCVNCASLLAEGQDWCLECGTAQPGRLGSKPGWRPALTMVVLTAVLAVGAVAAAYAALSSDAERRASAPPPPSAQPNVPPPVPAPPAPVDETPTVDAPSDNVTDDAPAPKAPKDSSSDTGSSSSAGVGAADPGSDSFSGDTSSGAADPGPAPSTDTEEEAEAKPEPPAVIALGPDAASTFDPRDRAGGLTGDPADAIDGKRKTAWEAPVNADGRVEIGLLVSLEKAQAIEKVRLLAGTPGFSVELYGSKLGTAPDDSPGATKYWSKLDTTVDFGTDEKLTVGGEKYRHILLWFTEQPADTKVIIPEVELLRR